MLDTLRVSKERLLRDVEALGKIGEVEGQGRTRLALSKEDFEARRFLIKLMQEAGLKVRIDKVGNIIGRREGKRGGLPVVAFGSHIDTVPNAGMFDGCLGVLSAIEVIRVLNDNSIVTEHPLEVISFSAEEGVRFPLTIGSKVATGLMSLKEAYEQRDQTNISYKEALEMEGLAVEELAEPLRKRGEIKAWVELHIEQGPVLYSKGVKIGIVEGIAGVSHHMLTLYGVSGHAGTVPMKHRRDPLLAAARIVEEVYSTASRLSDRTVGTVGMLRTYPGAINVIPAKVEMSIDFRDVDAELLNQGISSLRSSIDKITRELGIRYELLERARVDPTPMSRAVIDVIRTVAIKLGVSHMQMHSGAAHDTQNMARICDAGMIFVPSKEGISHSPLEWTEPDDAAIGADVLLHTVLELAKVR